MAMDILVNGVRESRWLHQHRRDRRIVTTCPAIAEKMVRTSVVILVAGDLTHHCSGLPMAAAEFIR